MQSSHLRIERRGSWKEEGMSYPATWLQEHNYKSLRTVGGIQSFPGWQSIAEFVLMLGASHTRNSSSF